MQVEAIYEHGQLEFIHPIQFKHDRLTLLVEVPDEEIETNAQNMLPTYDLNEFSVEIRQEVAKLQAMRGEVLNMSASQRESVKETEEQKQRWQAIEFRNSLRRDQGRS